MASTEQISKALADLDQSQGEITPVKMLLKALPHLFGGDRHQYQMQLTDMLRNTLKTANAAHADKKASTTAKVNEVKASLQTCQKEVLEAEQREKDAKEAEHEKASALIEKKQAKKKEEALQKEAKTTKEEAEKERQLIVKAKAEADSVANGSMQPLLQGGWEGEEARDDFITAVCDYLKSLTTDKALLAALPKALACSPDSRGEYSKAATDAALKRLNENIAEIAKELDDGAEAYAQVSAESLGAWAIADLARDSELEAMKAKESAEAKVQEATIDCKVAKDKVTKIEFDLSVMQEEQGLLNQKIEDIDKALAEIVRLETEVQEADRENEDTSEPAAKRMKLGEGQAEWHAMVA